MQDITNTITGSDTRLKITGAKLTRLNMLLNKLKNMKNDMDNKKKLIIEVYEKDEFVERVAGTYADAEEIITYYNENYIVTLTRQISENKIVVHIDQPIKKYADDDLIAKEKKNQDE